MKYDTISIKNNTVEVTLSELDRIDTETAPVPGLGFFHYARELYTKQQAFSLLKKAMIDNISEDISILTKELNKLQNLTYDE